MCEGFLNPLAAVLNGLADGSDSYSDPIGRKDRVGFV